MSCSITPIFFSFQFFKSFFFGQVQWSNILELINRKSTCLRIVDGLLVFIVTIRNFIRNTQLYWGGKPDKDNELIGETSRLGDRIVPPSFIKIKKNDIVSFSYYFQFHYTLIWHISSQNNPLSTKQFKKINLQIIYMYKNVLWYIAD